MCRALYAILMIGYRAISELTIFLFAVGNQCVTGAQVKHSIYS